MLGFAKKSRRSFLHGCRLTAVQTADPQAVIGCEPLGRVIGASREFLNLCKGCAGFPSTMTPRMDKSVGIGSLQLEPALARRGCALHFISFGERGEQRLRFRN